MLSSFPKATQAYQEQLELAVKSIFLGQEILVNARQTIVNPQTSHYFELDLFIPKLNLGFEFQDVYHFSTTCIKSSTTAELGITLITVPFWWDSRQESLIATTHFHRPDLPLFSTGLSPIPLNPPHHFQLGDFIPGVGEVMLASFTPSTAQFSHNISSLHPWWMGEKYDGVRCVWNSTVKQMYTRRGVFVPLADSYLTHLEKLHNFIDGEIWCGRGNYLDSNKIVKGEQIDQFRFVGFDDPSVESQNDTFELRYTRLLFSLSADNPIVISTKKVVATRMKAMKEKQVRKGLEEIIEDGGEGLVLRKPNSLYVQGRSDSLIKLKATQRDAEALVIATKPHNTFVLQTPSGQTFEVQATTIVPKKGQIVTYTHESYSRRDFPEDPHIVRIRHDLIWENVVRDSLSHPHKNASLNEQSKGMGSNFTTKSRMFWTANNGKNMRIFFEDFAKRNNFDPLVKDNWYNVSRESIYSQKEADSILIHFKRNYIKALMYLFPDIGLDESKFETRPVNYWDTVSNRRELFLRFAKEKGFDPLVVDNWYSVQKDDFVNSMKGARAMINQYGQHMGRALIHLFPDLHFTKEKLLPPGMRMDVRTKRNSLNQFMSSLDLDPLSPDSWYSLSASDLLSLKNLDALVYPHSNIIEALLYIYPSIGFDDSILYAKFYYYDLKIQRRFFIRFAKDNSMDPRIPQNWYSLSPSLLLRVKGASSVLWHYGGDYVAAIIALFPEINFEKEKFSIYKSESKGRGQVCMIAQVLQPLSFFPSVYSSSPWWVSEGYCTGIHVIWNHSLGKLIMESGSEIGVSPAMVKLFPSCPLDGDLWCGRGMSFPVRTSANNINWSFTRFIVMDRPQVEIELFEDRYKSFLSQIDFHHPFIINNAPVLISEGRRELLNFYNKIEKNSGILLRKPQSEYSYLSSSSLLLQIKKLPTQSGLVVEIPTEGSSFTLQLLNEDFITAPKSPHVAFNIEAGDVVKFQFTHFSLQGTFVNPEIIELSESIWDDIQSQTKLITEREILREQLDRFADIKGFDSLIPENWFSVPRSSLFKELNTSLNIYKILPNMLLVAYPNSFFDPTVLEKQIVRWRDIAAGRELLLKFASRQKFDYQQPDKWYSSSLNKLIDKDFLGILKILGLDVLSALFYLLPEIGLERRGFNFIPRNYWKNANNKRELLLQYSKKKKFDPLVPVNWELNKRQLRVQPHMSSVLKHYDGKLGAALKDLFPETNWQEYESALNKI